MMGISRSEENPRHVNLLIRTDIDSPKYDIQYFIRIFEYDNPNQQSYFLIQIVYLKREGGGILNSIEEQNTLKIIARHKLVDTNREHNKKSYRGVTKIINPVYTRACCYKRKKTNEHE